MPLLDSTTLGVFYGYPNNKSTEYAEQLHRMNWLIGP